MIDWIFNLYCIYLRLYFNKMQVINIRKYNLLTSLESDIESLPIQNIPSPGINIDTNVNAEFTAYKLNATESYFEIIEC